MTTVARGTACFGCGETGHRSPWNLMGRFCDRCAPVYQIIRHAAKAELLRAQRKGLIRDVTQSKCADCGAPARHNDHRDYLRPLAVEPTCHSCNLLRGPGINRGDIVHFDLRSA